MSDENLFDEAAYTAAPRAADIYEAEEKATDTETCPKCGGRVVYFPKHRTMKCEFCGYETAPDTKKYGEELNFYDLINAENNTWASEACVFRCNNCGAKTVLSKTEISKQCPFCGTTNVVQTEELCGLKPNAVLPFLLDKAQASESAVHWAKKRLFSPRKFKQNVRPEEISGNYSPAFTFDSHTFTSYFGRLGRTRTRTRHVNGKMITETYTEWFTVSGNYSMAFDDVLVQASEAVKQKELDKLSPFDTNNSLQYESEYLQGFSASQYTKSGQECWDYAKNVMRSKVRAGILSQYFYDVVGFLNMNMSCRNITYKYVLIPMYVGHYSFKQKVYNFFVNGRTGKVAGKAPVSPLRVLVAIGAGLVLVAGVAVLIYCMMSG